MSARVSARVLEDQFPEIIIEGVIFISGEASC